MTLEGSVSPVHSEIFFTQGFLASHQRERDFLAEDGVVVGKRTFLSRAERDSAHLNSALMSGNEVGLSFGRLMAPGTTTMITEI
jgi:hypothetical protein